MASQTAQLKGISPVYRIHPECKKYTLRDNGFMPGNGGRFEYLRSLDVPSEPKRGLELRVFIHLEKELLSIQVVGANRFLPVDLLKLDHHEMALERIQYTLENFEAAHILEKVSE
ncbi:hypothetical protein [Atopobacter phocae]|uniref:hypothetical protein n=1 Tax=Atopobacter phocae TaxID=136492 RepID=UPI0004703643|nr:hypothetical protein [Atopobacter phocae]